MSNAIWNPQKPSILVVIGPPLIRSLLSLPNLPLHASNIERRTLNHRPPLHSPPNPARLLLRPRLLLLLLHCRSLPLRDARKQNKLIRCTAAEESNGFNFDLLFQLICYE